MSAQQLSGRVAIVTGAAVGNGEGIAKAMAQEGANIALFDIMDTVTETAGRISALGPKAAPYKVDITSAAQVEEAVRQVLGEFGKVDILVNNAAIYPSVAFLEMTNELRDKTIDVNIKGAWHCSRAVLSGMIERRYGKIINVSSVTGPLVSSKGMTAYSATKGALSAFTRSLALEVAEYGVNVNAICPGSFDTPGYRNLASRRCEDVEAHIKYVASKIPLQRMGSLDDIGNLTVFLASDASSYITGTEIVIDGGNIIQEYKP
jgi:NAD(P)-dependent dehydrogenase (short-subunit alcohol dehydrogenase family)